MVSGKIKSEGTLRVFHKGFFVFLEGKRIDFWKWKVYTEKQIVASATVASATVADAIVADATVNRKEGGAAE